MSNYIRKGIDRVIELYQDYISPLIGRHCRFAPSCSQYTRTALQKHGVLKGLYLGIKRILRCNPFFEGGHDPVP